MASNFYRDNEDIQFCMKHLDLDEIVRLYEGDFSEGNEYPHAPESIEDAIDSYDRVLDALGEICAEYIAPRAEEADREGSCLEEGVVSYPKAIREDLEILKKADVMGFTLPRRYGGLNFPRIAYAIGIEMVSRADASLMTIFGLQDIAETILDFADDELKNKYLPRFASGEVTGAMVLTEPDAGSDLQAVQLKATEDPNEKGLWRLNGVKRFITNGCAEVLLVLARSEAGTKDGRGLSLFICEGGPDVLVRRIEDKLGIHGSPTCELQFVNTPAKLIGKRRRGLTKYVMSLMSGARVGIASQALGIAEAAYTEALEFAKEREQFGKKIINIPAVADMLAKMRVTIEASRTLLYDTCRYVDCETQLTRLIEAGAAPEGAKEKLAVARKLAAVLTPMSKYYITEAAVRITSDALQIHGGSGYMRDYPIERLFRDARITNIYEGTSQLQVVAVLAGLLGGNMTDRLEDLASKKYDKPLNGLFNRILDVQKKLIEAVEHVRNQEGEEYADLAGRQLTDMACDVYMAHLLLDQARHSERKHNVARCFINNMTSRFNGELNDMGTLRKILGSDAG